MQWWGYSKEHGWVVLDRSVPANASGLLGDLLFFRCRDSTTFAEKRKNWNPPLYRFAPNYIRDLPPADAAEAAAALAAVQALWPEYERQIQQEQREIVERAEAARIALEKQEKDAAREKRKQAARAATAVDEVPENTDC